VHILNIKRLKPIVRPTILTAFLGYVLFRWRCCSTWGKPY